MTKWRTRDMNQRPPHKRTCWHSIWKYLYSSTVGGLPILCHYLCSADVVVYYLFNWLIITVQHYLNYMPTADCTQTHNVMRKYVNFASGMCMIIIFWASQQLYWPTTTSAGMILSLQMNFWFIFSFLWRHFAYIWSSVLLHTQLTICVAISVLFWR